LPSEAEAFGVAVIEAMASGKPVIARDIIGPGDVVTPGHDGYLFRNQDELKQQILMLSRDRDLRVRLGKHAREKVERSFTFETVAFRYQTLLKSLLS
jgi:glycosyltransferase involved in cell wall biosynthesis